MVLAGLALVVALLLTTGCAQRAGPEGVGVPTVERFCAARVGMTEHDLRELMGGPDAEAGRRLTWEPRRWEFFHWRFDAYFDGGAVELLFINDAHLSFAEKRELPCRAVRT